MRHLTLFNFSRFKLIHSFGSTVPVRWKMNMKRKPRYLPVAPSKLYKIGEHPYVPPDEEQLHEDLLDEYYTKINALSKLFQEELKTKPESEERVLEVKQKEKEEFRLLLEENAEENERIRIIREEALEREFQEKHLELLQMAEEERIKLKKKQLEVENIVRLEKEKSKEYITQENIDAAIEDAINKPVNLNFCIGLDGSVTWEGKPSPEYEAEIRGRVSKGLQQM